MRQFRIWLCIALVAYAVVMGTIIGVAMFGN